MKDIATLLPGGHDLNLGMRTVCEQEPITPAHSARLTQDQRPVALIAETLGRGGGAEIYLTRLVNFLARNGHPVNVYVRRPPPHSLGNGIRVEVVPTMRRFRLVWERPFAQRVARRIGARRGIVLSTLPLPGIDFYQPHSGLYRQAFGAISESMGSDLNRKVYSVTSSLNFRHHSLIRMQEELLTRANPPKVMTFSRSFRAHFLEAYPQLASNVVTAPLGVDLERFHPGEEPANCWRPERKEGRLTLLFAAHNFRLKGLACLLTAFRDALRRGLDADLLVVGNKDGRNRAFLVMANLLGVGKRVRFIGKVSQSEMASLYRSCDALIHPTFSDHCSLVVIEALASGVPIITTRQNGACELMESGRHGIVLDRPDDIASLTEALLVLRDSSRLANMSAAAAGLRPRLDFASHARAVMSWLAPDHQAVC